MLSSSWHANGCRVTHRVIVRSQNDVLCDKIYCKQDGTSDEETQIDTAEGNRWCATSIDNAADSATSSQTVARCVMRENSLLLLDHQASWFSFSSSGHFTVLSCFCRIMKTILHRFEQNWSLCSCSLMAFILSSTQRVTSRTGGIPLHQSPCMF